VLFAQTALLRPAVSNAFELNRFVVRAAYTMVVGVLLALLAAYARQLRLQSSLVARVLTDLRSETSFTHALDRCVREIRTLFGARGAIVAIRHHSSGRTFVWTFSSAQDDELVPDVIADGEPNRYFFACPAAFTLGRRGNTSTARAVLDGARAAPSVLAASPAPDSARALVVCEPATEEWEARIFVLDPQAGARGARALRQLRELTRTFLPALYGVYLVSEVRERAETDERARLARDLHDTSIQSLIGLEMELRALERHTADATLRGQLVTLEGRLREEIRVLRALMAKRSDSRPSTGAITEQISEELARFQIETRIRARLVSSMAVVLPPRTGLTILRLVQAALSNVRRHSTASRVDVSIERDADGWLVVIADDGMFDERLQTTAPRTMQERVSALGGQLVVKRGEPTGVRVEIRLPLHMSS
jgi:signal transduction histidine kinase